MKMPGEIILQAVMGSHAYGLAGPNSDIDRKGVYVGSTVAIAGLRPPQETFVRTDPDFEFHEVGKFVRLALKCNPTVLEQLFVDDYEILTKWGEILVANRECFLSTDRVKGAFGGYAMDQINRLKRRGDGSFSSDVRKRKEKHARHCFRLLAQGEELLRTGSMTVKVTDPEGLFAVGRLPDDELFAAFEEADEEFAAAVEDSVLPQKSDWDTAERVLSTIRCNFL